MNAHVLADDCSARYHEVRPVLTIDWNSTEAPEDGARVRVLASDERGRYAIPFPVIFRDDCWFNARTGEELADEVFVEGWKPWIDLERDHD